MDKFSDFANIPQSLTWHNAASVITEKFRAMALAAAAKEEITEDEKFAICWVMGVPCENVPVDFRNPEATSRMSWKTSVPCAVTRIDGKWHVTQMGDGSGGEIISSAVKANTENRKPVYEGDPPWGRSLDKSASGFTPVDWGGGMDKPAAILSDTKSPPTQLLDDDGVPYLSPEMSGAISRFMDASGWHSAPVANDPHGVFVCPKDQAALNVPPPYGVDMGMGDDKGAAGIRADGLEGASHFPIGQNGQILFQPPDGPARWIDPPQMTTGTTESAGGDTIETDSEPMFSAKLVFSDSGSTVQYVPDFARCTDPYFKKLRAMDDEELRYELGEERVVVLTRDYSHIADLWMSALSEKSHHKTLLSKTLVAIEAFMDPEGNPPEDTVEFLDLKAVGQEIAAALKV
jgi:hypothetical protein